MREPEDRMGSCAFGSPSVGQCETGKHHSYCAPKRSPGCWFENNPLIFCGGKVTGTFSVEPGEARKEAVIASLVLGMFWKADACCR